MNGSRSEMIAFVVFYDLSPFGSKVQECGKLLFTLVFHALVRPSFPFVFGHPVILQPRYFDLVGLATEMPLYVCRQWKVLEDFVP